MVCYYHPDRQAVGLCVHCQRGICSDCVQVVEDVLACKNRHEVQVRESLERARREQGQARRARANYARNAILYGLVGIVFAGYGWLEYRFLGLQAILLLLIGAFMLIAAAATLLEGRRGA